MAAEVAARWGIATVVADHRSLLDCDAVDAVIVVAPRRANAPIVLDALEAGMHVLAEKPMAYTLAQARRLAAAARSRRLVYAIGFMKRHDAGVARLLQLLTLIKAEGRLGDLLLARFFNFAADYAAPLLPFIRYREKRSICLPMWPASPDWLLETSVEDYDLFMNVACHDVNLMRYVLGDGLHVLSAHNSGANHMVATLSFGSSIAVLEVAKAAPGFWHQGIELLFEHGRVLLQLPSPVVNEPARITVEGMAAPDLCPPTESAFQRQADSFITDILTGSVPLASGEDAVKDLILIEDIWRHVETSTESPADIGWLVEPDSRLSV